MQNNPAADDGDSFTASKSQSFSVLVLILASLIAFAPLSIDIYLPAFPQIAETFAASPARIELSLTAFFTGLALGQLCYGTATDRFGRKTPLYVGLTIYCLAQLPARLRRMSKC